MTLLYRYYTLELGNIWAHSLILLFANYCVRKKVSLLYFAYLLTTNDNYIMHGSCDIKRYRQICNFGSFFAVLTPWNTTKPKFRKKSTWRYYHFIYKYHKWRSYDVCFLRYGAQWTEFVFTLGFFLPFYSCLPSTPLPPFHLTTHAIKIFKKWKKLL